MKKNLLLLCLPALVIIFTPSCKKQDLPDKHQSKYEPVNITVELKKNQTYHYTLQQNQSDGNYKIITQAEHFSVSEISTDKIYTYTPALNYVGADRVVIADKEQSNNTGNCGFDNNDHNNNNNGCGSNYDNVEGRTITINFIIKEKEKGKKYSPITCPSF